MSSSITLRSWFAGTTAPFICNAPMLGHATASLATTVSQAGGLGFIGGGYNFSSPSAQISTLAAELSHARSILEIEDIKAPVPVGVGFLTFESNGFMENVVPVIAEHRPIAVWLFAPKFRSQHLSIIPAVKKIGQSWGIKVLVMVGNLTAAREAVEDGADALVVQGIDAGGHQWANGAGIISLVPEVKDMLEKEFGGSDIPIIAAGGIVDGRGVAAALVLGADGVAMGTRFVATKETPILAEIKEIYVSTSDGAVSTIKSTVHDDIQGTGIWPALYDGRAIIGNSYRDFTDGVSMDENIEMYKRGSDAGDLSRKIVWAGSGVGLITSIVSAKEVVAESQMDATEILDRLSRSFH